MNLMNLNFNSVRYKLIAFLLFLSGFVYYIFNLFTNKINNINLTYFTLKTDEYFIITFFIAILILLCYSLLRFNTIYLVTFIGGVIYIFGLPYFSPIDEGAHFAVVQFIAENYKMPLVYDLISNQILAMAEHVYPLKSMTDPSKIGFGGVHYEAFQPPLYYFTSAIVYKLLIGNIVFKFYGLRCLGLLYLLISIYFVNKIYNEIVKLKLIEKCDFLFFSIVLLFSLSPGILLRMTTVSNLHLLLPIASLLLFIIVKYTYIKKLNLKSHILVLGLFSGILVLTHSTTVFFIPLIIIFLILKKEYKNIVFYLLFLFLITLPWFIFNYLHYGQLTAGIIVQNMQQPAVNPNYDKYGIYYIIQNFPRLLSTFINPQEAILSRLNIWITDFISGLIIVVLLSVIYYLIINFKNIYQEKNIIKVFTSIGFFSNIALICYITISQSWDILIGRYVYMSVSLLILIFLFFLDNLTREQKHIFSLVFLVATAFLFNEYAAKLSSEIKTDKFSKGFHTIDLNLKPLNNNHIGPLTRNNEFTQSFLSLENKLTGINLYVSTFTKQIKTPYKLILKDGGCNETIRESILDNSFIKDNDFVKINFDPIPDSLNKNYCFTVLPLVDEVATPLTLQLSAPSIYPQGEAIINKQRKEEDIVFQLIYKN
ncbi:hypothetical protein [Paenibacillus periandrae]|uniref:hypothetical protein n=1 Tax=Paenibacillus periandrae TaxID=1761741 RepID=UPI001F090EE2|nr:hypothetical protein [Paenibacillus periandrae]